MSETTTRKLNNKDVREAFNHICEWVDEKYGAYYDDGAASFNAFCEWFEPYVVEPTADHVNSRPVKK